MNTAAGYTDDKVDGDKVAVNILAGNGTTVSSAPLTTSTPTAATAANSRI